MINLAKQIFLKDKTYPLCSFVTVTSLVTSPSILLTHQEPNSLQMLVTTEIYHSFLNLVTRLRKCDIWNYPLNKIKDIDVNLLSRRNKVLNLLLLFGH